MSDEEREDPDEEAIRRRREALIAQQGPAAAPRPPHAMPQTCLSMPSPQVCLSPVRPPQLPALPEAHQPKRVGAAFVIAVVVNVLAAIACVVWWLVR